MQGSGRFCRIYKHLNKMNRFVIDIERIQAVFIFKLSL